MLFPGLADELRGALSELHGIYDTQRKCIKGLRPSATGSVSEVKATLEDHLRKTKGHITRIEQLLEATSEADRAEAKQAQTY